MTSSVGGSSQTSAKYAAKPVASAPAAAKLEARKVTVTRKVSVRFLKALLT